MNVSFLETFYWVGTLKSFSEAAKRLRLTQPVVSMRMAALQRELGATLYRGSGKTFELTNAGRRVLLKCEAIVVLSKELAEQAREAASAATTGYVGVTDVMALSFLPEFLRRLSAHQSLNVGIKPGSLTDLKTALGNDDIDMALMLEPINDPTLLSDHVCELEVRWVGSPDLLPIDREMNISELVRLPIIRPPRNTYRYERLLEYFRWHEVPGVEMVQPRWIDVGLGIATSAHLASRGVGVTALPIAAVSHFVNGGSLSIIDVPQDFRPWRLAAVRKRSANPIVVEAAIECARRAASEFEETEGHGQYFRAIYA